MPLAYKVGAISSSGFNNGTVNVPLPSGLAIGDLLLLFAGFNGSAESALTYPAAFTRVTGRGSGGNYAVVLYKPITVEADLTAAVPVAVAGSGFRDYRLLAVNGADLTQLPANFVAANNTSITASTLEFPALASTAEKSATFLYGVSTGAASTTFTAPAALTVHGSGQRYFLASEELTAAGTSPARSIQKSQTTGSWPLVAINFPVAGGRTTTVLGAATANPTTRSGGRHVLNDAGAWVPERTIDRRFRAATRFLSGVPVMSRCKHHQFSQATDQLQSRVQHVAMIEASDLRWVFSNVWGVEQANPNSINVSAALELPSSGGTSYGDGSGAQSNSTIQRITFNGATTVDIPPGSYVISDPLPVRTRVGQAYFTRTLVTAPAGGQIPTNILPTAGRFEFVEASSAAGAALTDKVISGVAITNNNGTIQAFRPQAIMGTPAALTDTPSVVLMGDSIIGGANAGGNVSWPEKALERNRVPHFAMAMSGETGTQFAGNPGLINGFLGHRFRGRLVAGATDVISNYGVNDFNSNGLDNIAQVQANTLRLAQMVVARGARFHQATITPKTTSTDTWATEANQANAWSATVEADRVAFNAWLRDGAPTVSGAAVAVGTTPALRAGQTGHPITGVVDVEAAVAVTRASDGARVWSPNAYTSDGLHPGDSGHNAMANVLLQYATTHFAPFPA